MRALTLASIAAAIAAAGQARERKDQDGYRRLALDEDEVLRAFGRKP